MSPSAKRRWTPEDEKRLIWYWGTRRPEAVAKLLGRTVAACRRRIYLLTGRVHSRRGLYSQHQLAAETGYLRADIRRAARALNISVRAKGRQAWRLTEDQKDRILAWLANEGGSLTGMTYVEAAEKIGIHKDWVRELARRLGIDAHKGTHSAQLTPEEVEQIKGAAFRKERLARGDVWSLKYDHCQECGTDEKRHRAHGLCSPCYRRRRKLDKG